MKIVILTSLILAGFLTGCGDFTSHSNNSVDNSTDNSRDYVCRDNNSTSCYTYGRQGYVNQSGEYSDVADTPTGDYSADYSPAECAANGYFYCSIQKKCLNIPADSGSCK